MRRRLVTGLLILLFTVVASPVYAATDQHASAAFDAPAVDEGDVVVTFTPGPPVSPRDASGCNRNVCIYLTGSGLDVDRWRTTAYVSGAQCTTARFWANGTLVRSSSTYCTSSSGILSATWHNPGTFANNTQACNSWTSISGHPCKTIYR